MPDWFEDLVRELKDRLDSTIREAEEVRAHITEHWPRSTDVWPHRTIGNQRLDLDEGEPSDAA